MIDKQDRETARLDLENNVVVEAGAGTGKTTLLIDRLCFWLLGKEGDVEQAVALTFTEKAAAEIKVRLTRRLEDIIRTLEENPAAGEGDFIRELKTVFKRTPDEISLQARHALQFLDRAQVGTIHSFASHILRLYPLEAGIDPASEIDGSGDSLREVFEREWNNWLESELGDSGASPGPRRPQWESVLSMVRLEDLAVFAFDLCTLKENVETFPARAYFRSRAGCVPSLVCNGGASFFRGKAAQAEELIAKYENGRKKPLKAVEQLKNALKSLKDLALLLDGEKLPAEAFSPPVIENVKPGKSWAEEDSKKAASVLKLAQNVNVRGQSLVQQAYGLLKPFADIFRERYSREGFLSFDDLLVKSRDLLKNNPDVRRELKQTYRAFFVDEFQDTDPLQGELLLFLCETPAGNARQWRDVKLEKGKLFVVGDPKQSIYRFRGADIGAFSQFVDLMRRQGAGLSRLRTNFRSHSGITEPVNSIFSRIMVRQQGVQPEYVEIKAQDAYKRPPDANERRPDKGIELALISNEKDEKVYADDWRENQADFAVRWIHENVGKLRLRSKGGLRPLSYRDVALLLRSGGCLGIFLDAFKRWDIPYVVEEERYFYSTQEVADFLNVLKVLDNPSDRISMVGILRSPLAGLTDSQIYELGKSSSGLGYERPAPAKFPYLEKLYSTLRGLRSLAGSIPLGELAGKILNDTFFVELASLAYHGEQTVSNLFKLQRIISLYSERYGLTLKEFVKRSARFVKESRGEGESPLADELLDAVNILTVHKAKGLEFPVVLFPNISAKPGGGGGRATSLADWSGRRVGFRIKGTCGTWAESNMAILESLESERETSEEIRVLYVAMTRAKEKLILMGNDEKLPKNSMADFLSRGGAYSFIPVTRVPYRDPVKLAQAGRGISKMEKTGLQDMERLSRIWKERARRFDEINSAQLFVSPTAIAGEPEKTLLWDEEGRQEESGQAALVGRLCHRVLECWRFDSEDELDLRGVEEASSALKFANFNADWKEIAGESFKILKSFMGSRAFAEIKSLEILGREIPFIYPRGSESSPARPAGLPCCRQIMRGTIDLLCKRDGKIIVIDYKSEHVKLGNEKEISLRYSAQGRAYKEAVGKCLGGPGEVKETDLEFQVVFLRSGITVSIY